MPDYLSLPCLESLLRYAMFGDELGSFCMSMLRNDFMNAAHRADAVNRHRLFDYASLIYNVLPASSWGSPATVDAWFSLRHDKHINPDHMVGGEYPEILALAWKIWGERHASSDDAKGGA